MSYLKRVLQPDEKVRFVTRLHWIKYLPGLLILALALIVWIVGMRSLDAHQYSDWPALALLAIALCLLFWAWFKRWTTEIAVTSKRIIYKEGFISRKTFEINLDKVESVDVNQSILGRIFGYGNLDILGVGEGRKTLKTISSPIEMRNHVTAE